jgi:hypothetical protein
VINANTPNLNPRGVRRYNEKRGITSRGTPPEYALAKLRKDRPDIHKRGRPKDEKPYNEKSDVRVFGNSPEYALAKLRKDRPDIHKRVLIKSRWPGLAAPGHQLHLTSS